MSQKSVQNYIPALTGVRAFAAYLVFISHFAYVFDSSFPHLIQRFLGEFHIGVSIFFVLSGFLITFRYYNSFNLTTDWFKQYLKNRVARIYPMYFFVDAMRLRLLFYYERSRPLLRGNSHPIALMILNITFVRGFFYQFWDTGIAQGWSLTVEECFYFSAPIIFLIAKKYNKFYIQPVITLFAILMVLIFSHVNWHGFFGNFTFVMLFTFFGRCFEFFVGIQLARHVIKNGFTRTKKINFTYWGFALIFVCVFIMALQPITKPWTAGLESPVGIITNNYFLCIAVALFFYGILTETTIFKRSSLLRLWSCWAKALISSTSST